MPQASPSHYAVLDRAIESPLSLNAGYRVYGIGCYNVRHGLPNLRGPDPTRTPRTLELGRDLLDGMLDGK